MNQQAEATRPATEATEVRSPRALRELSGPPGLPFLGNLLQLEAPRLHRILGAWADRYGSQYRMRLRNRDVLVVADAECIGEVLRNRPEGFRRRSALRNVMLELGVDGVFNAEGADWRRQRKLAMYALNTTHMREFFERLDQVAARLQRRWEGAARNQQPIDPQRDLMRFTVDVTSGLAFGQDLNTLEETGDPIQKHLDKIFPAMARRLLMPFAYWRYFKLPKDRELDRAMAEVHKLVNGLIANSRAQLEREPARRTRPTNFLEAMLVARDDDAGGFTDSEITGNALTMLLAGEDTTANTLAWMMHFMVEHPHVQAKMRDEANRVLGERQRVPDYASADLFPTIEAVAHEAMRLEPVAPVLAMEANHDCVVGDVAISKGTAVFLLMAHAEANADNFVDPHTFRPERWLEPGQATHNAKAFMPFGSGPRFCPGRHLAMLEIKLVAAMLVRNFEIVRTPGSPPTEEHLALTLTPRNLSVILRPRGG